MLPARRVQARVRGDGGDRRAARLSIRDYDRAVYMKVSGDAFHIGGYEHNPIRLKTAEGGWDVEDGFSFGLYDLDYDVFGVHLEAHVNRVPAIEDAGLASTVCGPESFTPDHRPLMGETSELKGFYMGCGLNSAGILYSGGFGRSSPIGSRTAGRRATSSASMRAASTPIAPRPRAG